jgi:hypothetical protein
MKQKNVGYRVINKGLLECYGQIAFFAQAKMT